MLDEFRDMVKALPPRRHRGHPRRRLQPHRPKAERRPDVCYRGLANDVYYILEQGQVALRRLHRLRQHAERQPADRAPADPGQPALLGHRDARRRLPLRPRVDPVARRAGHPLPNPPVLWDIESDPLLAGTKLIAEAWDAAGLYQVGSFVGDTWQEWNGRFRDDVRRFVKGDNGTVPRVATRLLGSPDIYGHEEREAEQSINFVTCHDGFTLNDLVSLQPQAQRGQRRGQPRRRQRQPELELRRRRTDRRSGDRGAAQPPGQELLRAGAARRRARRCCSWATRCAARSRATTTPTARTTRSAGSTGAC